MGRSIYKRKLDYGADELISVKVEPNAAFLNLMDELKKYGAGADLHIVWAWLNPDIIDRIQFALICKFKTEFKEKNTATQRMMLISAPNFSLISLQGYELAKKDYKTNDYFDELTSEPIIFPMDVFKSWIVSENKLSLTKDSPNYYKNPQFGKQIAESIDRLGLSNHRR